MYCAPACVSAVTVPLLTNLCNLTTREDCPSKLVVLRCDVALPTGTAAVVAAAIEALLTAGTMGVTGKLKNFVWADPATTDVSYADCLPNQSQVTGRDLSFDDYNAYDVDDSNAAAPYFDRTFWAQIASQRLWNFGWTTCSGKLYMAQHANGQLMTGGLSVFQTEDRSQPGKCIEVKRGKVSFLGDPLGHFPKPFLDIVPQLGTAPTLAGLF